MISIVEGGSQQRRCRDVGKLHEPVQHVVHRVLQKEKKTKKKTRGIFLTPSSSTFTWECHFDFWGGNWGETRALCIRANAILVQSEVTAWQEALHLLCVARAEDKGIWQVAARGIKRTRMNPFGSFAKQSPLAEGSGREKLGMLLGCLKVCACASVCV